MGPILWTTKVPFLAILAYFRPEIDQKITTKNNEKLSRDLCALKNMYKPPRKFLGPPQTIWGRYYGCQGAETRFLAYFRPEIDKKMT